MTADPASALRAQARDWGRSLLASPPWAELEHGLSLLLIERAREQVEGRSPDDDEPVRITHFRQEVTERTGTEG